MTRSPLLLLAAFGSAAAGTLREEADEVVMEAIQGNSKTASDHGDEVLARAAREGAMTDLAVAWVYQAMGYLWLDEGNLQKAEESFVSACRVSSAESSFSPRLSQGTKERWAAVCARTTAILEPYTVAGLGYSMRPVSAGTFTMGSPDGTGGTTAEPGRDSDETPHTVRLTRPFWIGATEVTRAQYGAVMGATPSNSSCKGDTCPVENVSWCDAVLFANALTAREPGLKKAYTLPAGFVAGMDYDTCNAKGAQVTWDRAADGYRLPTEAEWEYVARAGTQTAYWSGGTEADLARVGWYDGNAGGKPHPVGERNTPNAWGLHDVHGNVWEWVWDATASYSAGAVDDPAVDDGARRQIRGGGWRDTARWARSADRYVGDPGYRDVDLGFRLARSPSPSR